MNSLVLNVNRLDPYDTAIEIDEHLEILKPLIEKIQRISEKNLSKITILTLKYWMREFKTQSYPTSMLKILSIPLYVSLLGIGGITAYASINLLVNCGLSSAFSPDLNIRVNYANEITNVGALFACITDLPAISYFLFTFVIRGAYDEALHEIGDANYHSCINDNDNLTLAMHEELYHSHISILEGLGLPHLYRNPDIQSRTGMIHKELSSLLIELDQEMEKGISMGNLSKMCVEEFRQESCVKKLGKITMLSTAIFTMAVASLIVLENGILLKDTRVTDLSSGNTVAQINEAMAMTQLGGLFSSLTAFGVALYMPFFLFVKTSYNNMMHQRLDHFLVKHSAFLRDRSIEVRNELRRIREVKYQQASCTIL